MQVILNLDGSVNLLRGEKVYRGQQNSRQIDVCWETTPPLNLDKMVVQICVARPDGEQSGWQPMIRKVVEDKNHFFYTLQNWDTQVSGTAQAQIRWYELNQSSESAYKEWSEYTIENSAMCTFIIDNGVIAQPLNLPSENQNAMIEAEAERQAEEIKRQLAEAERIKNEDERLQAETERQENEQTRQDQETERVQAEEERKTAETERKDSETKRERQEEDRVTNSDRAMLESISFHAKDDTLFAKKEYRNIQTGDESEKDEIIPLATETNAGAMSINDFNQIRENTSRIEQLEGKPTRIIYTESQEPTASDINAFALKQGYKAPFTGVAVVIDQTFNVWRYYTNLGLWKDSGKDTVQQFTNEQQGVLKGSNQKGKIFAEADGTGSVVGWDELNQKVDTNLNSVLVNDEEAPIKDRQVKITIPKLKILI